MGSSQKQIPEIVVHPIREIHFTEVTDDELQRIREHSGQVGQDLSFALSSGSICISFLIAIFTATLNDNRRQMFWSVVMVSAVTFAYTGIKWWRNRKLVSEVFASIEKRRNELAMVNQGETATYSPENGKKTASSIRTAGSLFPTASSHNSKS